MVCMDTGGKTCISSNSCTVSTQLIALSIMKVFCVYFEQESPITYIYWSRNINEVKRDNMHYLKENNCSTFVYG